MAQIRWSGLMSEMKGKLNGSIFQGSADGQIMRNRKSGGGRNTLLWRDSKADFAYVVKTWRDLSAICRETWEVQRVNWPFVNKFGENYIGSAFQLYVAVNMRRRRRKKVNECECCPPEIPANVTNGTVTEDVNGNILASWTPLVPQTFEMDIYASLPQTRGVQSVPKRKMLIARTVGHSQGPTLLNPSMTEKFGQLRDGQKFFFTFEVFNNVDSSLVTVGTFDLILANQ